MSGLFNTGSKISSQFEEIKGRILSLGSKISDYNPDVLFISCIYLGNFFSN